MHAIGFINRDFFSSAFLRFFVFFSFLFLKYMYILQEREWGIRVYIE